MMRKSVLGTCAALGNMTYWRYDSHEDNSHLGRVSSSSCFCSRSPDHHSQILGVWSYLYASWRGSQFSISRHNIFGKKNSKTWESRWRASSLSSRVQPFHYFLEQVFTWRNETLHCHIHPYHFRSFMGAFMPCRDGIFSRIWKNPTIVIGIEHDGPFVQQQKERL